MRKVKKLKPQKLDKSLFNTILSNRKCSLTNLTIQNKEVAICTEKKKKKEKSD